jgi:hypothetical protein
MAVLVTDMPILVVLNQAVLEAVDLVQLEQDQVLWAHQDRDMMVDLPPSALHNMAAVVVVVLDKQERMEVVALAVLVETAFNFQQHLETQFRQ